MSLLSNISKTVLDYGNVSNSVMGLGNPTSIRGGVNMRTLKGKCVPRATDTNYVLLDVITGEPLSLTGNSIPNVVVYESSPELVSSDPVTFQFVAIPQPVTNTSNDYEIIQNQTGNATDISLSDINNKYCRFLAQDGLSAAAYEQTLFPFLAIRTENGDITAGELYLSLNYFLF